MNVQAIYEGGVLRPLSPLALADGEMVELTIALPAAAPPEGLVTEDEIVRRIKACNSFREWVEVTKLLPADDGGYDIVKALDENRRWSGEQPLLPD